MHARSRVHRWLVRAFALLGLAVCTILPIGAIGTIDASFDRSVAVPLTRSAGRHLVGPADRRPVGQGAFHAPGDERHPPVTRHALDAPVPAIAVGLLAALVLLVVLAPASPPLAGRPTRGLPHRRGPPFPC